MTTQILDPRAGLPLYHQLADLLRRRIISGELAVGATLPTEAQLMAAYSVSRVTARQAAKIEGAKRQQFMLTSRPGPACSSCAGVGFSTMRARSPRWSRASTAKAASRSGGMFASPVERRLGTFGTC